MRHRRLGQRESGTDTFGVLDDLTSLLPALSVYEARAEALAHDGHWLDAEIVLREFERTRAKIFSLAELAGDQMTPPKLDRARRQ